MNSNRGGLTLALVIIQHVARILSRTQSIRVTDVQGAPPTARLGLWRHILLGPVGPDVKPLNSRRRDALISTQEVEWWRRGGSDVKGWRGQVDLYRVWNVYSQRLNERKYSVSIISSFWFLFLIEQFSFGNCKNISLSTTTTKIKRFNVKLGFFLPNMEKRILFYVIGFFKI